MLNKEIFQCRHCGVQFGAGTHFNSLMSHWKEFHGRSIKCPNAEEKFSKLLDHIQKNKNAGSLGFKNEGLVSIIKHFSNVPLQEKNSKENESHTKNFNALLDHCISKRKQDNGILHERAGNETNNRCSEAVSSLPRSMQLKTESDLPNAQLACKNCPMTFSNPISAVLHHKKAHTQTQRKEVSVVDKNNNSIKKEVNPVIQEFCKAEPDNHITDKENEQVRQSIKAEPDFSLNTSNRTSKLARDDVEDVIVISDDNSDEEDFNKDSASKSQGKANSQSNAMVKSRIDYSDIEIIDLTSNETAIEEILNQREIIQQFLSRSTSTEPKEPKNANNYQKNSNEKDLHAQISPSSPGKEKERVFKKSKNHETEKRKRPRDDNQGPKRKKKRKKSKESGKIKTGENFEEVGDNGSKRTEEKKIKAKENSNLTEKVSTSINIPKSKSVSPWEELIWNSTKDPKFSKESSTACVEKENESKETQCEDYRPKPLRRQSARKSCPSKKANKVNVEAIRRATDEDEYEFSDQWPFSVHNSDSSSEEDCGDNVDVIWTTVMSSLPFDRTFGMYKISPDKPGRFLHRKLTSDGREVNDEATSSPVQPPPEPARKRRTARKSTRSRPSHLEGTRQMLLDSAKSTECECHACGQIISTDHKDLFRHYTQECNKNNM